MARSFTLILLAACILFAAGQALGGEIHRAIEAGDVARVKEILAKDPGSANAPNEDGQFKEPPIHTVANTGSVEIAKILLKAGAKIDAGDSDNSTALGVAAMRRHADLVAFLIKNGADVNKRDNKGDCPLSFAVYGRDEAIIMQIVEAGADLDFKSAQDETLLHIACQRGVTGFVKYLLEHGADMEAKNSGGGTPLGYAAMRGHADIVKMLLEHGADMSPDGENITPLIYTMWGNQTACAQILVDAGADVNARTDDSRSALHFAAENTSAEMVDLLIKHGAKVNHLSENNSTALTKAVEQGAADRATVLLAAGADPNLGTDMGGRPPLHIAALNGYTDIAKQLLDAGARVDAASGNGRTPIQLACYYGHADCAGMLKERGASGKVKPAERSLSSIGNVGKNEAVLWFLGHAGWAVKTRNNLLIFDYFPQGEMPARPGLCNGKIDPAEFAGYKVTVFASHLHGDHFHPSIFEWKEHVDDISYFLGLEPQEAPEYTFMTERMVKKIGDIKLTTIKATDAGVGMLVEVDGLTILHAGDHANGEDSLMKEFTDEIDFLAGKGIRPDICMLPIRGCSLGSPDQVKEGSEYALRKLRPKVFIPVHAGNNGDAYRDFIGEMKPMFTSIQMVAPENRGDHFVYRKGKIEDPRPAVARVGSAE